ncbi:MAG: F0F1 ATP synthase subunit B [bacterium Ellin6529]|nr:F0F1 ATP synthase subunit B [bacterium Ellin6529]
MQIVSAQMIELIQGVLGVLPHATAAAGEAEAAGLSFNLFWILISAANFGFFIIVLRAAALGPITKMLDERRERIERGLRDAADAALEKGRAIEAADASLAEARRESNEIRANAEKAAAQIREGQVVALKQELEKMRADATAEIEAARVSALTSIRSEVADLAISAATKVVGASMDGDRQRALVGEFLDEQRGKGN